MNREELYRRGILPVRADEIEKDGFPYCAKCGTPRFVQLDDDFISRCICKCQAEERNRIEREKAVKMAREEFLSRQKLSMLGKRYYNAAFHNALICSENADAYRFAKNYCDNAKAAVENDIGMYFFGENSTGKTYLTACMCNELLRKGYSVLYTSVPVIIAEVQRSYSRKGEALGIAEVVEKLANTDFVFIDDLGKEFLGGKTGFAERVLLEVLNARYNNEKPTIFSSNYTIKQLAEIISLDRAIIERIGEMSTVVVPLVGVNFRRMNYRKKDDLLREMGL